MFVIRFVIYFTISFTILSIPVGRNNIFFHLQKVSSPYTQKLFTFIKNQTDESLKSGKKFFSNSSPEKSDQISSKLSSTKKKDSELERELAQESYTNEEKELLRKLLK